MSPVSTCATLRTLSRTAAVGIMGCPSRPRSTVHPPRSVPDPDFTLPESMATRREQQEGQRGVSDPPRVGTSGTEPEDNGRLASASAASPSDAQRSDRVTSASPRSSNVSDTEILPQGISPPPSITSTAAVLELEGYPGIEFLPRQVLAESGVALDSKDDDSSERGSSPEMPVAMPRGRLRIRGAGSFTPAA